MNTVKKITLTFTLSLISIFLYGQGTQTQDNPHVLRIFKGGVVVDSVLYIPERSDTSVKWYGKRGNIFISDSTLYYRSGTDTSKWYDIATKSYTDSLSVNIYDSLDEKENKAKITPIEVSITTAAATVAKVGTTTGGNYTPQKGDILILNFTNSNTGSNPTLNIDGSGAIPIRVGNANPSNIAVAGTKVLVWFDGTNYQLFGSQRSTDTNTTYSEITEANIINSGSSTTGLITGRRANYLLTQRSLLQTDSTVTYVTPTQLSDSIQANKYDTTYLYSVLGNKINYSDTGTMLLPYLRKADTASLSSRINGKLSISDTSTMLSPYLRKVDTFSLNNRINSKLNITDTTGKWLPIGTIIPDSSTYLTNYRSDTIKGNLRSEIGGKEAAFNKGSIIQGSNVTITGTLTNRLVGSGDITINASGTVGTNWGSIGGTLSDQTDLNNALGAKLNISDTGTMLTPYLQKIDTTGKWLAASSYIPDSSTFATLYRVDTAKTNLRSEIGNKLNISDTTGKWLSASTYIPDSTGNTGFFTNYGADTLTSSVYDSFLVKENKGKIHPFVEVSIATGASTAAKVGTTIGGSYTPQIGDIILLNFNTSNTASNPSVNIDGSGAISIRLGNSAPSNIAVQGTKVLVWYDGTYYQLFGSQRIIDNNTTYSEISTTNIINPASSSTGLITGRRADYLLAQRSLLQTDSTVTYVTPTQLNSGLNTKLNINDTSTMLSPYFKTVDTTGKWLAANTYIPDSSTFATNYRVDTTRTNIYTYLKGSSDSFLYRNKVDSTLISPTPIRMFDNLSPEKGARFQYRKLGQPNTLVVADTNNNIHQIPSVTVYQNIIIAHQFTKGRPVQVLWRGKRNMPAANSSYPIEDYAALLAILEDGTMVRLISFTRNYASTGTIENITVTLPYGTKYLTSSTITGVTGGHYMNVVSYYQYDSTNYDYWQKEFNSIKTTTERNININRPSFARVDLYGLLPFDGSVARTPDTLDLVFKVDESVVFKSKVRASIQGNSTTSWQKRNFDFRLLNNKNQSLTIKFGDWVEDNRFHIKACWNDETKSRDVVSGRIWNKIINQRNYPDNLVSPYYVPDYTDTNRNFLGEARFFTDGFPIEIYLNGEFLGVYIWRQRKNKHNYNISSDSSSHIQLECMVGGKINGFDTANWELRNPDIPGYVSGGGITDTFVLNRINRFFDWAKDCIDDNTNFLATYENYIDKKSFVDFIIFIEYVFGLDNIHQNVHLLTYDGYKWIVNPYDLDLTYGYRSGDPPNFTPDTSVLKYIPSINQPFFELVKAELIADIEARYAELRNSGIINAKTAYDMLVEIPNKVGLNRLERDFNMYITREYFTTNSLYHRSNVRAVMTYITNRIAWLDNHFNYTTP